VQRLIDACSSSGDYNDIDREVERYEKMQRAGPPITRRNSRGCALRCDGGLHHAGLELAACRLPRLWNLRHRCFG
jgi:hypothetical protein